MSKENLTCTRRMPVKERFTDREAREMKMNNPS
jgi:hypothetical protein